MTEASQPRIDAKVVYDRLLRQLGLEMKDKSGKKLRHHPRFSMDTPERTVLVQIDDFNCALQDVSIGGLSFRSTFNFNIGRRLEMSFDGKFRVRADVVRVSLRERDEASRENIYLHGCRFANEADGYRCTVLVLSELIKRLRQ